MMTNWKRQYRAIVRRPASFIDGAEARDLGYVLYVTQSFDTKEDANRAALYNSAESHAIVIRYESRTATYTPWERDD